MICGDIDLAFQLIEWVLNYKAAGYDTYFEVRRREVVLGMAGLFEIMSHVTGVFFAYTKKQSGQGLHFYVLESRRAGPRIEYGKGLYLQLSHTISDNGPVQIKRTRNLQDRTSAGYGGRIFSAL